MNSYKLIVASISITIAFSVSAFAQDIDPDAAASNWRSAKASDRLAYSTTTSILCQSGNCSGGAIKACIDEVTRPPAPVATKSMTIGELAISCIKILNAQ
jgi:hypothetical protein